MKEIRLTQQQMQEAMQHYLNDVVLKQKVIVTQVTHEKTGGHTDTFSITVSEPDPIKVQT